MTKKELDKRSKLRGEITDKFVELVELDGGGQATFALGFVNELKIMIEMSFMDTLRITRAREANIDSQD